MMPCERLQFAKNWTICNPPKTMLLEISASTSSEIMIHVKANSVRFELLGLGKKVP